MTEEEYRSSGHRETLRELLLSPSFELARSIILGKLSGVDVQLGAPETSSVRLLSTRCGYEMAFADLIALTEPKPPEEPQLESDFGEPEAALKLAGQQ